jgi:hypothetical protein
MHARIVRFTDVDPDHLAGRLAEMDAPPVESAATAVQVFHDPDQRTAVVIQQFGTADDMAAAESAFDAMDPPRHREDAPRWTAASSRPR